MNLIRTIKTSLSFAALALLLVPLGAEASIGTFFYDNVVLGLFGTLLGWSALILNWSINTFVIGFGDLMDPNTVAGNELNNVVTQSWETLRDLFNLTFIFGLVYIGFKMILRTDDGQTKRWLVNIILAALLVNFSLFITKFVIDVSNITAVEIINLADSSNIFTVTAGNEVDLSGDMQNITKLSSAGKAPDDVKVEPEGSFAVIFGTMFLFIITAFVYLSAGILLIARGGILILLMIVSPFLFIGMVLPVFQNTSAKLWSTLFKRAFLAPIFLAILYISMSVAGAFTAGQGSGDYANALGGDDMEAVAGVAFGSYILIIMLLLSSLTIAQKLGAEGAGAMINAGNRMRRGAQRKLTNGAMRPARFVGRKTKAVAGAATAGAGAAVMRRSLGRLAYKKTNDKQLHLDAEKGGLKGLGAKAMLAAAKKASESSFDPRAKGKDTLARNVGGYAATAKANDKKEKELAKRLEREAFDKDGKPEADFEQMRQGDEKYTAADREVNMWQQQKNDHEEFLNLSKANLMSGDTELNDLKAQRGSATDPDEKQRLDMEVFKREQALDSEFTATNQGMINELSKISASLKTAKKTRDSASARLEGKYKYQDVNELKKTREKQNTFWKNQGGWGKTATAAAVGGAGTGAAVGAVAGPAGAAVGAAVGAIVGALTKSAVVNSKRDNAENRVATITKEYGVDADTGVVGGKKIKNQEEDGLLKKLKEKIKEDESGSDDKDKPETV